MALPPHLRLRHVPIIFLPALMMAAGPVVENQPFRTLDLRDRSNAFFGDSVMQFKLAVHRHLELIGWYSC
jgi:hypothetical protein